MNPSDLRASFFRRGYQRVVNSTGAVIPPFSVVRITTSAANNNEIRHTVAQPNSASTDFFRDNYLVTWPFQIGSASTAEGMATALSEPGYVRYDSSGTPAIHDVWGPKHSQLTLSKNYYGFYVLGGNTTAAGQNVTIAKQIGVHSVVGKVDDATVNKGSTCTVSVWDGARAGDTTMNVTGVVNSAINLTSVNGKKCIVVWPAATPELVLVECS